MRARVFCAGGGGGRKNLGQTPDALTSINRVMLSMRPGGWATPAAPNLHKNAPITELHASIMHVLGASLENLSVEGPTPHGCLLGLGSRVGRCMKFDFILSTFITRIIRVI